MNKVIYGNKPKGNWEPAMGRICTNVKCDVRTYFHTCWSCGAETRLITEEECTHWLYDPKGKCVHCGKAK